MTKGTEEDKRELHRSFYLPVESSCRPTSKESLSVCDLDVFKQARYCGQHTHQTTKDRAVIRFLYLTKVIFDIPYKSTVIICRDLFSGDCLRSLTIELKECRRRMACPYSRVLCPPLCAAYRDDSQTHVHKRIVTCQLSVLSEQPQWSPSNRFNRTSDTECWPHRRLGWPQAGGTHLLGRVCTQSLQWTHAICSCIREWAGYGLIFPALQLQECGRMHTVNYCQSLDAMSVLADNDSIALGIGLRCRRGNN